ncbi:unnamed protein product [Heterobilharzia americana]|nr:unnamed protein product [Heterobilharzia americana]CAH8433266.1 unnamed protein product [Heterobilharzia americana]
MLSQISLHFFVEFSVLQVVFSSSFQCSSLHFTALVHLQLHCLSLPALSASMCPSRSIPFLVSSSSLARLCRFPSTSLSNSPSVLPCGFLQECCLVSPTLS